MKEVIANNIEEYVSIIMQQQENLIQNGAESNEMLLFRGQANKNFDLMPKLGRGRKFAGDNTIFLEERNCIEMAKFLLPNELTNNLSPIETLAFLQHHGIPTRLLDVTENALVALYFACKDDSNQNKDGEVIVFVRNEQDVANYPIIEALADTYRFCNSTWKNVDDFFEIVKQQPYFLEHKHLADHESGQWIVNVCKEPIFILSSFKTVRQQQQQSRFILFPNKIEESNGVHNFLKYVEPLSKEHECVVKQIIIPHDVKKKILRQLACFGIDERMLFGDNVDCVCHYITEKFNRKINPESF